jgi:hypothetical protein
VSLLQYRDGGSIQAKAVGKAAQQRVIQRHSNRRKLL